MDFQHINLHKVTLPKLILGEAMSRRQDPQIIQQGGSTVNVLHQNWNSKELEIEPANYFDFYLRKIRAFLFI